MEEILSRCDGEMWLYFDCEQEIMAEKILVTNGFVYNTHRDLIQIVEIGNMIQTFTTFYRNSKGQSLHIRLCR